MKTDKKSKVSGKNTNNRRVIRNPNNNREKDHHVNEMLKLCFQKVCELQAEIAQQNNDSELMENDPEMEGYTACLIETFRYLRAQGFDEDHPIVKALSERLLHQNRE